MILYLVCFLINGLAGIIIKFDQEMIFNFVQGIDQNRIVWKLSDIFIEISIIFILYYFILLYIIFSF